MMSLSEPDPAAWEPAAAVGVMERRPEGRRDRARSSRDLYDTTIETVPHHHAARVARQAPRRFRGNVRPVLEDGLAGLIGIGEGRGIDVDDHLVSLSWRAGIYSRVEGRLREQAQRVRLLLGHGGRFRGNVRRVRFRGNARATL